MRVTITGLVTAAESQLSGVFHNKSIHTQTEHALIDTLIMLVATLSNMPQHNRITIGGKLFL